jgi:hypothetical protein
MRSKIFPTNYSDRVRSVRCRARARDQMGVLAAMLDALPGWRPGSSTRW